MAHGRSAALVSTASVLWTAALIPLAFLAPAYHGESSTSGAETATLVAVNGTWVVGLLCIPVGLALTGWLGLHLRCSRGGRAGRIVAWSAVAVLTAFAVVSSASIGLFVLPAVALLAAGTSLTP